MFVFLLSNEFDLKCCWSKYCNVDNAWMPVNEQICMCIWHFVCIDVWLSAKASHKEKIGAEQENSFKWIIIYGKYFDIFK